MNYYYTRISKFLSYILRHHPEKFNLKLDDCGFANINEILGILNKEFRKYEIDKQLLMDLIRSSDRKRFELINGKIRAFYGHSFDHKINMNVIEHVPNELFHGTDLKSYQRIKHEGLRRKRRQYVHLSNSLKIALKVGKRRTNNPIILVIDSKSAQSDGITFYKSGDMYLADYIPPKYIILHE